MLMIWERLKKNAKPIVGTTAIVAAASGIIMALKAPALSHEMLFSEFVKSAESGLVDEVQFRSGNIAEVWLKGSKQSVLVAIPVIKKFVGELLSKNKVSYGAPLPPSAASKLIPSIITVAAYGAFCYWFYRKLFEKKDMGQRRDKSSEIGRRVTFADVAGCVEAKTDLAEIVDYLGDPEKYLSIGARLPRGVLLIGPSGTGKTLLARAVAGEAGVPFLSVAASEFVEEFVGRGAARVRSLFEKARELAPCIVFIDEIDSVGQSRDTRKMITNEEREQTLNQLLTELDGFEANSGIVVMAATNRYAILDEALTRPGRFDRHVKVDLPSQAERTEILQIHSRNVKMSGSIDWQQVAKATQGFCGADLANLVNEAAFMAIRDGKQAAGSSHVVQALERALKRRMMKAQALNHS